MATSFRKMRFRLRRNLGTPVLRFTRMAERLGRGCGASAPSLFVSALPKSGSTLLTRWLREATGFPAFFMGEHFKTEQELSFAKVVDSRWFPHVTHQHCSATQNTLSLMRRRGIRPVFLHRNLYDVCVSIYDKLPFDPWLSPTYAVSSAFLALPREQKMDVVIRLSLPHQISCYASWWLARAQGEVDVHFVSYEDMLTDGAGTLVEVLKHFGLSRTREEAEAAIERTGQGKHTRFNKGVAGRGQTELTGDQRKLIDSLTSFWPHVDFRPLGLPHPPADTPTDHWTRPVSTTRV